MAEMNWMNRNQTTLDLNLLRKEISNWIFNYLDVPSDYYSGNRPCPFAAKAWLMDRVHVIAGRVGLARDVVTTWEDDFDVVIICIPEDWSDGVEDYCEELNTMLRECNSDLILIPFIAGEEDPDDPQLEDDWGALIEEAYSMVFVQRLGHLNQLSYNLDPKGYYKKLSPHFIEYVEKRRSLTHGTRNEKD